MRRVLPLLLVYTLLSIPAFAFFGDPGPNPDPSSGSSSGSGSGSGSVSMPVDGGLSLLALAGVGYGLKKIRNARKNVDDARNEK